jgi:hypothetical protein
MSTPRVATLLLLPTLLLSGCVGVQSTTRTWSEPRAAEPVWHGQVVQVSETVEELRGDPAAGAVGAEQARAVAAQAMVVTAGMAWRFRASRSMGTGSTSGTREPTTARGPCRTQRPWDGHRTAPWSAPRQAAR